MRHLFWFVVLTSGVFHVQASLACSCPSLPPYVDIVTKSQHIFVARVVGVSLTPDKQWMEAKFEVEEIAKGIPAKVPVLRARYSDRDYLLRANEAAYSCRAVALIAGARYMVFANGDDAVEIHECSISRLKLRRDDGQIEMIKRILASQPLPNE